MGLILYVDFIILPRIYRVYKKVADSCQSFKKLAVPAVAR